MNQNISVIEDEIHAKQERADRAAQSTSSTSTSTSTCLPEPAFAMWVPPASVRAQRVNQAKDLSIAWFTLCASTKSEPSKRSIYSNSGFDIGRSIE